jgi:radical SAM protein with 4Fe4S-binding SPASM domain
MEFLISLCKKKIERVCFYHLAYTAQGRGVTSDDCQLHETRAAIETILNKTRAIHQSGYKLDVLTVDNHADGPYLYLKMKQENHPRAEMVRQMLEWNGGGTYSSGVGIADIDFTGNVHADQFWMDYSFGNVRQRKFSEIWMDTSDPIMAGLKNRLPLLTGRCSQCQFLKMCGGSLRVRAKAVHNDVWASDPACYLSDEEIGVKQAVLV